ncbi:hypothetical protein V6N13_130250 [Hibiscus sabdariffa]|uniref:Uncharacterized protein n=1 Tax=Hibiscus sabdariffa TaxID=183260 RepID=A0ABR2SPC2_9ROSI
MPCRSIVRISKSIVSHVAYIIGILSMLWAINIVVIFTRDFTRKYKGIHLLSKLNRCNITCAFHVLDLVCQRGNLSSKRRNAIKLLNSYLLVQPFMK